MRKDQLGWIAVAATLVLIFAGFGVVAISMTHSRGGDDSVDVVDAARMPTAPALTSATPSPTTSRGAAASRTLAPPTSRPSSSSAGSAASHSSGAASGSGSSEDTTPGGTSGGDTHRSSRQAAPRDTTPAAPDPSTPASDPTTDSPASDPGPVQWVYSASSTQLSCGIQVRNARNPVTAVQVQLLIGWRTLVAQQDGYFINVGTGCGGVLRAIDADGNTVTGHPALLPGVVQDGDGQF